MEKIEAVMNKVNETVDAANDKLAEIVGKSAVFSYDEVEISVEADSAGIYVHSGATPVAAVHRAGDPERVVQEIVHEIWAEVDAIRTAVERRGHLVASANLLREEDEKHQKAAAALAAAGLSADMLDAGIKPEVAEAVVNAAKKAVKEANRGLFMVLPDMPLRDARMSITIYSGGVVILAGKNPAIVTRFSKVGNARGIEKMVQFMAADIAALNESRRRYFMEIRRREEREEWLHELADRTDSLNALVAAAM